ncbi:Mitochondrial inner membrane protein OXA1L Hsa OXA1Hs Oxidase assembly 1-like protein [Larimichthys crocea]|uniref:Mitochondrial inner membrane protein OXA1L Hsa OXA1Hs Oxidase assembly 1-like protein n=1 Tax=Larimichthys crocea TaxID=215358 RepID=A0A6G0HJ19_LARCR|nr:Mitochondrial inner membrane protein OXA1L Hsa OXA1Hs Oxidase assembly 1-like protein [Larimichthys crocea]
MSSVTERLLKSHLHTVIECRGPAARTLLGRRQQGKFLWVSAVAVRHNSSQIPPDDGILQLRCWKLPAFQSLCPLTLPPSSTSTEQVADAAPTAVEVLTATETSLAELGLGAYTPVGLIQNMLEFMHVDLGLPWWGAIVVGTVLARLAVFPVIVKGQREAAKLNNVCPR